MSMFIYEPIEYNLCKYNFLKCNYADITFSLASIDWYNQFKDLNINEAVNVFYSIIYDIIDIFVPKIIIRKSKYPLWYSKSLKELIFKKKIAHKLYKSSGLVSDYNKFSNLRSKCKFFSKKDNHNYLNKIQLNLKTKPDQFWKFVNSKRKTNFLPNNMYWDTDQFNTPNDIVNAFANYFSSVSEDYNYLNLNFAPQNQSKVLLSPLHSCSIDLIEVFESLNSLSSTSSPGPDLLPNIFLRNCKFVISSPLLYLFNLSLSTGIFPDTWKTSFIRPIPKST